MGWFVQSDGGILKTSFCDLYYTSAVGATSPISNPSLYIYPLFFVNELNKQTIKHIFPWNNFSVIIQITRYSLPYQLIKPPLWIYIYPFPPHLCWFRVIKIPPNWPIQTIYIFYTPYPTHHTFRLPSAQASQYYPSCCIYFFHCKIL